MADLPRRMDITRLFPAELVIREAMIAVENLGADPRLTEAVILLAHAKHRVADFVDGLTPKPEIDLAARVRAQSDELRKLSEEIGAALSDR